MTLPTKTYEDRVGTRIKVIDYDHMAYIVARVVEDEPQQTKYLLEEWGNAIYGLGQTHKQAPHLKQPLKAVAS